MKKSSLAFFVFSNRHRRYRQLAGHTVVSPREAVAPEALAVCAPLADHGGVIPPCAPFRVEVTHGLGCSVFTVFRGREPVVTCGLTWTPEGAAEAWPGIEELYLGLSDRAPQLMAATKTADQPAALPWLAVVILPPIHTLRPYSAARVTRPTQSATIHAG